MYECMIYFSISVLFSERWSNDMAIYSHLLTGYCHSIENIFPTLNVRELIFKDT